jgi:chemotaxis protein MotB
MKKIVHYTLILSLLISLIFNSCSPSKKFTALEAKVVTLQKDSVNTLFQLKKCNAQVKILNDENASLQNENLKVQEDLKVLTIKSKMTVAEQANRLKTLQDIIHKQQDKMLKLRNSISNALIKYKVDDLSVYTRDGNVYISFEERFLFKSGSDVVNIKGKEALKLLALVLNTTEDVFVMVEGHTDNVPINNNYFKDNWNQSTARAASVLRILTTDYGFDPNRITASGKGKFHPVESNETAEGRARNRRTEIILTPNLNELFRLLDQPY